jgi:Raf kinase inhibitor-like YbhB/YbcL family protein
LQHLLLREQLIEHPQVNRRNLDIADGRVVIGSQHGLDPHGAYGGPCPPPGKSHRYFFKVYALNAKLDVRAGANKEELERAMKGHVLAQGELMGKYGR